MFCHICANWLNIPVLKALRQNCVPVEWPWDRAKVSPSCSFQTCGAGWKCDMKYCQGWFRPECGSGRSSGPVQSWEEKLRQPLLIDHPLVREEDDDSGSWWPRWWWSCVDNDRQEGWKRPAQIAWARCKWPGRCKLNSGTATPDCPQKINKFARIYIYSHILHISEYWYKDVHWWKLDKYSIWIYMWWHQWCQEASPGANSGTWTHRTLNTQKRLNTESTILIPILHFMKIPIISQIFRIFERKDCLLLAHWHGLCKYSWIWNVHSWLHISL